MIGFSSAFARLPALLCKKRATLDIFFRNLRKLSLSEAVLGHCHDPLMSIKASWLSSMQRCSMVIPESVVGDRSFPHRYCISTHARDISSFCNNLLSLCTKCLVENKT